MKKGEMTSKQIAVLILTIAGFIIALVFLVFILDLENFSEEELCQLSIIARATSNDAVKRLAPLECSTKKICLTESGDCDQFLGETRNVESPTTLSKDPKIAADQIEAKTAEAMLNCWEQMGEGKLDLFGGSEDVGIGNLIGADNLFQKEAVCMICSRIAISEDVSDETLDKVNIQDYIENTELDDGKTYLRKLTNDNVRAYTEEFELNLARENEESSVKPTREIAIVYMQINTPESEWEALTDTGVKSGGFIFGTGFGLGPFGKVLSFGKLTIASVVAGAATGGVAFFQTKISRGISVGYCGDFTSVSEAQKGCSVLTTFDYENVEALNQYCSKIEGNP